MIGLYWGPPAALCHAVKQQEYAIWARVLGIDAKHAADVLRDVIDELSHTGTTEPDPWSVARRRLLEPPEARAAEHLRDIARQALAAGGYSLHPEVVDQQARQLQRICDAYQPADDVG